MNLGIKTLSEEAYQEMVEKYREVLSKELFVTGIV